MNGVAPWGADPQIYNHRDAAPFLPAQGPLIIGLGDSSYRREAVPATSHWPGFLCDTEQSIHAQTGCHVQSLGKTSQETLWKKPGFICFHGLGTGFYPHVSAAVMLGDVLAEILDANTSDQRKLESLSRSHTQATLAKQY